MIIFLFFTSTASAIKIVGQWGTGQYLGIHDLGNVCCCAAGGSGIDIIDVSDHNKPVLLASFDTSGESCSVFMVDGLVYVADGSNGLLIINITIPSKPWLVGHLETDNALQVQVLDNKAYIADDQGGLLVVDVSNPKDPTLLGSYDSPGYAVGVFVTGTTAYLADDDHGLQIIDVSEPEKPKLSGNYNDAKKAVGIWVKGDTAYIADTFQGLQLVNISDPSRPQLISSTKTQVSKVQVIGNIAYIANGAKGLQCYDVSNQKNPVLLSSGVPDLLCTDNARGVIKGIFVSGNTAYMAFGSAGLRMADVSNSTMPVKLGFYNNFSGFAADVWVEGSTAYLAAEINGLQIIDVSKPANPVRLGNFSEYARAVQVVGTRAYIGGAQKFSIIDISNPALPVELGHCPISAYAKKVYVTDYYAYVAEGFQGFQVISISDPGKPEVIASYNMPGYSTNGIEVTNYTAYVADSDKGLEAVDLHHIRPYTPRIVGDYDTPGSAEYIDVAGSTVYIADDYKGLQIIDVTDPTAPSLICNYQTMANNVGVQVVGDRAYLLNSMRSTGNLQVIDITKPNHPVHIDACDTFANPRSLQIVGDKAYIADGSSGRLLIMDLKTGNNNVYFPHAACSDGWRTEIALINSGPTNALGKLTAYDDQGREVSEPITIYLNPWARSEIIIHDSFSGNERKKIAYLIFATGSHNFIGYTKFYHHDYGYRAALPAVTEIDNDTLYISHLASNQNWWTGISLLNTTPTIRNPVITFSDGRLKVITLAPGANRSFSISKLFNGPQPQIESATITDCEGIIGFELFGSSGTGHQLGGISLSGKLANVIYYPHIASDSNWWTGIAVYDPKAANQSLSITPYTKTGIPFDPITINFNNGQKKFSKSAAEISLPENTAWLRVDAAKKITGFELFGSADGNQLGGYTGVGIKSTHCIMPKLDRTGWTGIALINSEVSPAFVILEARDDNGKLIAEKTIYLDRFAKILGSAPALFSDLDISKATYVSCTSGNKMIGFQLNGDGLFLDALPALSR